MTSVIDFCTPAVPGEVHKYYGYSHNKFLKLPHINPVHTVTNTPASNTAAAIAKRSPSKSKEHKTLRSVALSGNLALLRQFLQMVPDQLQAVNDPHPATGLTCLHFAASRGHLKIIQCLVEEYAVRVDSTDKEGEVSCLRKQARVLLYVMWTDRGAWWHYIRRPCWKLRTMVIIMW